MSEFIHNKNIGQKTKTAFGGEQNMDKNPTGRLKTNGPISKWLKFIVEPMKIVYLKQLHEMPVLLVIDALSGYDQQVLYSYGNEDYTWNLWAVNE